MSVWSACDWCPQKSEEGISAPGTGVTYMVVSFCVDTGNQTQVKVLLTTEPPLQPQCLISNVCVERIHSLSAVNSIVISCERFYNAQAWIQPQSNRIGILGWCSEIFLCVHFSFLK